MSNKANKVRSTTITGCARCGQTHQNIEVREFTEPADKYTHFAICPSTNEPILIYMTETRQK